MSGTCVIGLQWGDEAKGKLVDLLTSRFDVVVRYQGGANAGHTVVVGDKTYKLHHIPSGILSPQVMNVVTPGVVINPPTILQELDSLDAQGVKVAENLMLSDRAHVVFPWHIAEDKVRNESTDRESIGTTLRGIGPCYGDKVGRLHAVRLGDMFRPDFKTRVEQIVAAKNKFLAALGSNSDLLDANAIFDQYSGYAARLKPFVTDTTAYLLDAVEDGKRMLFEGAQGSLLDIDHGTFPYVTSSNASGVGVSAGSGVPGKWITKVLGVCKAYTTRVGGGPFPTELKDEMGNKIRELGREYGTTTGRPRRCGWFDAVAVRYTSRLSGVDAISLMMMDVLSQLPEVKICTAYEIDGERTQKFPSHVDDLRKVVPIYETVPGWLTDVTKVRKISDLPLGARKYIDRITELVGKPVEVVSVGPDRAQTMFAGSMIP
ncbi:adenylosuccinate synthase [Anatilimnocola sp. NA78]|uniref:adenylosuccinate synthase n=1 Tax=Anatilimnocola sp. NA78 TaxID=3415683 RepID=UPI003CE50C07